jgi:hypothetical protein
VGQDFFHHPWRPLHPLELVGDELRIEPAVGGGLDPAPLLEGTQKNPGSSEK